MGAGKANGCLESQWVPVLLLLFLWIRVSLLRPPLVYRVSCEASAGTAHSGGRHSQRKGALPWGRLRTNYCGLSHHTCVQHLAWGWRCATPTSMASQSRLSGSRQPWMCPRCVLACLHANKHKLFFSRLLHKWACALCLCKCRASADCCTYACPKIWGSSFAPLNIQGASSERNTRSSPLWLCLRY